MREYVSAAFPFVELIKLGPPSITEHHACQAALSVAELELKGTGG